MLHFLHVCIMSCILEAVQCHVLSAVLGLSWMFNTVLLCCGAGVITTLLLKVTWILSTCTSSCYKRRGARNRHLL
jgi:hypothetical protein